MTVKELQKKLKLHQEKCIRCEESITDPTISCPVARELNRRIMKLYKKLRQK